MTDSAVRPLDSRRPIRPDSAEVRLRGSETLELAGLTFEVVEVPGHSPGHLSYATDGAIFSGDA